MILKLTLSSFLFFAKWEIGAVPENSSIICFYFYYKRITNSVRVFLASETFKKMLISLLCDTASIQWQHLCFCNIIGELTLLMDVLDCIFVQKLFQKEYTRFPVRFYCFQIFPPPGRGIVIKNTSLLFVVFYKKKKTKKMHLRGGG